MKNKKNLIKIGAISFVIWCLGLSFSSAGTLHLTGLKALKAVNENELTNKIIQIHFADNWNNFGGFFYYSNLEDESDSNSTDSFTVGIYGKNLSTIDKYAINGIISFVLIENKHK